MTYDPLLQQMLTGESTLVTGANTGPRGSLAGLEQADLSMLPPETIAQIMGGGYGFNPQGATFGAAQTDPATAAFAAQQQQQAAALPGVPPELMADALMQRQAPSPWMGGIPGLYDPIQMGMAPGADLPYGFPMDLPFIGMPTPGGPTGGPTSSGSTAAFPGAPLLGGQAPDGPTEEEMQERKGLDAPPSAPTSGSSSGGGAGGRDNRKAK